MSDALIEARTRPMRRRLHRCVPFLAYRRGEPASFLYTSGRRNRCNPPGVDCLYFSEARVTAEREYRSYWRGTPAEHQPVLSFQARVTLGSVLDLSKAEVLGDLGLEPGDLSVPWRGRPETALQRLGAAVAGQDRVTAVRYPSAVDPSRWNVAIFPAAVRAPDRVEILGGGGELLEALP